MITVWGRATSGNTQMVVWALNEIGLPYERLDFGGAFGRTDTPTSKAMATPVRRTERRCIVRSPKGVFRRTVTREVDPFRGSPGLPTTSRPVPLP